jgi:N-methylhydantoinase A/oxoprolinase/acetone carboxylase beta subunit
VGHGKYFLGIDIGGTFTDLVLAQETGIARENLTPDPFREREGELFRLPFPFREGAGG